MTDEGLKLGLGVGLVGGLAAFAAGLDQTHYPHSSVMHHGLLGCILVAGGLLLHDDFLTPALAITGVGMAVSDPADFPQWLDLGALRQPSPIDTTRSY